MLTKEQVNAAWEAWKSQERQALVTAGDKAAIDEQMTFVDVGKGLTIGALEMSNMGLPIQYAMLGSLTTAIEFGVHLGKLQTDEKELNRAAS